MSKYIIELDDRIKIVTSVGVTENGVVYTTSDYVHNLEELNSDYINEHFGELQDEAYHRGLEDATKMIASDEQSIADKAYQSGLEDAWDAARKIAVNMDVHERARVFFQDAEAVTHEEPFKSYTAQEAIAKLKAYEDGKHSDRIEVGDEVSTETGKKYTVVSFGAGGTVCGFNMEGKWTGRKPKEVTKTGRHFDIQSILGEMKS